MGVVVEHIIPVESGIAEIEGIGSRRVIERHTDGMGADAVGRSLVVVKDLSHGCSHTTGDGACRSCTVP